MLQHKKLLQTSSNLLAFSGGGDSTALLFLLLDAGISFDIAIVDYEIRAESYLEVAYAQELSLKYGFKCHTLKAPQIETNFEANARKIRYDFFEELIAEHKYENLLSAHHLGDRLEWMLMQFCKGAGAVELTGMHSLEKRESYTAIRPLLHKDKQELLEYLHSHNITYFEDETNRDEKYKRNEFRHKYAEPLLQEYKKGILKSFEYLDADAKTLFQEAEIHSHGELSYFSTSGSKRSDIINIDKYFKKDGLLISASEKKLLNTEDEVVISRRYIVAFVSDFVFILPFIKGVTMQKIFKEKMRLLGVTPKMRAYLAADTSAVLLVSGLLE